MILGGMGWGTIQSRDPPLNSHHVHGVSDSEGSEVGLRRILKMMIYSLMYKLYMIDYRKHKSQFKRT